MRKTNKIIYLKDHYVFSQRVNRFVKYRKWFFISLIINIIQAIAFTINKFY